MDANGTTSIGVGRGDGRSTKGSPSITSRWAACRPMPLQPSTAHTRGGQQRTAARVCRSRPVPNRPHGAVASSSPWSAVPSSSCYHR